MKIPCPTCNTSYSVTEKKIPPGKRGVAACKKCGSRIVINADLIEDHSLVQTEQTSAAGASSPDGSCVTSNWGMAWGVAQLQK